MIQHMDLNPGLNFPGAESLNEFNGWIIILIARNKGLCGKVNPTVCFAYESSDWSLGTYMLTNAR